VLRDIGYDSEIIEISKRVLPLLITSIAIVLVDRILKIIIFNRFSVDSSFPVIEGILHITPTYNTGAAFSLFKGHNIFILIAISVATIIFILYLLLVKRPKEPLLRRGLFLILAGSVGNLIDRLAYRHVLDFIDLRVWPVFNIADASITTGACLILVFIFVSRKSIRGSDQPSG